MQHLLILVVFVLLQESMIIFILPLYNLVL